MQSDLKQAKDVMFTLLTKFDQFCKENDLTYWISYGTLLGSIRHRGFIPWDDDIDLCMPRDDYERCLKLLKEQQIKDIFVQTKDAKGGSSVHYLKLRDTNSIFMDSWEAGKSIKYHQGIFIDIYPMNCIKNSKLTIYIYKHLLLFSKIFANRFVKIDLLAKICIKVLNHFHDRSNSVVVLGAEGMVWDGIIKKEWIYPLKSATFEGQQFPIPNDYSNYLTLLYGSEYMKLPPVKDRLTHNAYIKIDEICSLERELRYGK